MLSENQLYSIIIVLALLVIILSVKLYNNIKLTDRKNIELIKYHLDTKFICKHLLESLSTSDPNVFCSEFIHKIKEYYYLEDVIIIDSLNTPGNEVNTVLRKNIVNYIKNNISAVSSQVSTKNMVRFKLDIEQRKYNIHISKISSVQECAGWIICVEKSPSLLAAQERNSLENSVNLLKNRLFYS